MKLDLINRLIEHYEQHPNQNLHCWDYSQCAAGLLYWWGIIPDRSTGSVADALQIPLSEADNLVYGRVGPHIVHYAITPPHAVSALTALRDQGRVSWPSC